MGLIKEMALDLLCKQAKEFGCTDADIAAARAEAEKTNSDEPMRVLIMPALKQKMGVTEWH